MAKMLSTIFFGIIVLTFVIFGGFYFVKELSSETAFDVNLSEDLTEDYDYIYNITDKNEQMLSKLQNASTQKTLYLALIPDVLSIIKDVLILPVNILFSISENMTEFFNLPSFFSIVFIALITFSIIFAFMSAVLRWDI